MVGVVMRWLASIHHDNDDGLTGGNDRVEAVVLDLRDLGGGWVTM